MDEPPGLPSSEELLRRAKEAIAGDGSEPETSPARGEGRRRAPSLAARRPGPQPPAIRSTAAPEGVPVDPSPADPGRESSPPDPPAPDAPGSQDEEAVDRRARVLRIAGGVGLAAVMVSLLGSVLAGLLESVPEPVLATVPMEITTTAPPEPTAPTAAPGAEPTLPAVPTKTTKGTVTVRDPESVERLPDGSCAGTGQYAGLAGGASVLVRDAADEVLAETALAPGARRSLGGVTRGCEFAFTVELPEDRLNYLFEIGGVAVTLSRSQLRAADWEPGIDLGG